MRKLPTQQRNVAAAGDTALHSKEFERWGQQERLGSSSKAAAAASLIAATAAAAEMGGGGPCARHQVRGKGEGGGTWNRWLPTSWQVCGSVLTGAPLSSNWPPGSRVTLCPSSSHPMIWPARTRGGGGPGQPLSDAVRRDTGRNAPARSSAGRGLLS